MIRLMVIAGVIAVMFSAAGISPAEAQTSKSKADKKQRDEEKKQRDAEKARLKAIEDAAQQNEGDSLTDAQLKKAMDELGHANMATREQAAETLALAKPDAKRSPQVIKAFQEHVLKDENPSKHLRGVTFIAVNRWSEASRAAKGLKSVGTSSDARKANAGGKASAATIAALRRQIETGNLTEQFNAISALGALKDSSAAAVLVHFAGEQRFRINCRRALETSGPAAAPVVADKMLKHADWNVRNQAAEILGTIGTPAQVPALESAADKDDNGLVRISAKKAIEAIRKRGQ